MKAKEETQVVFCDCHSPEHQIIFTYWPDDEPVERMVYVTFHLTNYDNFFKRLWVGLRYAFGYRCQYGHWDEVMISVDTARKLWEFLCDFLENKDTSVGG